MPRNPSYANIPTAVLEDQQRAQAAASWAQRQRAELARRWADMHMQDARATLEPLLARGADPGDQGSATSAPATAATTDAAGPGLDQLGVGGDAGGGPGFDLATAVGSSGAPIGEAPTADAATAPAPEQGADQGIDPGQRYLGPDLAAPLAPTVPNGRPEAPAPAETPTEAPWTPPRQITPQDVGQPPAPAMRPEYRRISGLEGRPSPADIPALVDVPNRVGFQTAEALATGRDPGQALLEMGTAGGRQARGADLLAAAGVPEGPARDEAGKIVDAALDYTNAIPGLTLSKDAGLVRQLIVEPLGAVVGSEVAGKVGEMVAGERGRAVGELAGGLVGAGLAGQRYERTLADPRTQRLGIVPEGMQPREGETLGDVVRRQAGLERQAPLPGAEPDLFARAPVDVPPGAAPGPLRERQGPLPGADPNLFATPPGAVPPPPPRQPGSRTPVLTEQAPLPMTLPGQPAPSLYDRVALVRMAGMLSGVPTHLLNAAGNVVQGGVTLALKPAQVGVDLGRVGVGRALGMDVERQRYLAEVGPQARGYAAGVWTGLAQVPSILARGADDATLAAVNGRRLASGSAAVDTAVELPLRMLAASDAVFRGAAFGGHAAALATRQATQEGLSGAERAARAQEILGNLSEHPGILESANKLAARDVFQESRGLTDTIATLRREHGSAAVVGDVFLPFYKTPYNVAAQGAGMTPLGFAAALKSASGALAKMDAEAKLAKGLTLAPSERAALRAGAEATSGEAVDRAVRATLGTAGVLVGLNLAGNGLLTGAYPTDATERSTLPEGWKPYSVRIPSGDGAVYVPVQALGALAVPLGVSAIMVDAQRRGVDKNDLMRSVYAGLGGVGQFMGDVSALQGLNAISKLVTAPERSAEALAESLGASAVPYSGLMRSVQQALGDAQRNPAGPIEAFMAGVPGLSRLVPEKQTPLGQPRERGPAGPLALLTGSRIGVEQPSTVLAALREAKVGVPDAPKEVSRESVKNVPLTEAERRAYRRLAGDEISARVQRYVDLPAWRTAPAAERVKKLEKAITDARDAAELKILQAMGADEAKRRVARTTPAA